MAKWSDKVTYFSVQNERNNKKKKDEKHGKLGLERFRSPILSFWSPANHSEVVHIDESSRWSQTHLGQRLRHCWLFRVYIMWVSISFFRVPTTQKVQNGPKLCALYDLPAENGGMFKKAQWTEAMGGFWTTCFMWICPAVALYRSCFWPAVLKVWTFHPDTPPTHTHTGTPNNHRCCFPNITFFIYAVT